MNSNPLSLPRTSSEESERIFTNSEQVTPRSIDETDISSPTGSPPSSPYANVSTPPGSPYANVSTPPGSPRLPDVDDLVGYLSGDEIEVPNQMFINNIGTSFQNLQLLGDICVSNLQRLIDRQPLPTEAGINREPNNENIDPEPIEFAINVIILILTYLPFLICQSLQIINYTIGSVVNAASFTTFNDQPDHSVVTISSAIFSVLFVKITTILNNIFMNMYRGRLAWTYTYRFSTSFFIVSFFFYCLGLYQRTLNVGFTSGSIDLFFKVIIATSSYLPEPFHTLWNIPVDCGINGMKCVIPYFLREKAYEPIQIATDKANEVRGKFKALLEEVNAMLNNTTQHIWNETTIGVAGLLTIIPNTTRALKENINNHPDIITDTIHNVTETNRKLIQDKTRESMESVVDVTSGVLETTVYSLDNVRLKSIEFLIVSQYPVLKEDLEEYNIQELKNLLQLLQTPITITDTSVKLTYNRTNTLTGPLNRFLTVTGTDIPMGYVPIPSNNNLIYDTITMKDGETITRSPRSNEKKNPWGLKKANDEFEIPSLDDNINRIINRPISNIPERETRNFAKINSQGRPIFGVNVRQSISKSFPSMGEGRPVKTIETPTNLQHSIMEPEEEMLSELVPYVSNQEVTNPYAFYFNAQITNLGGYLKIPEINTAVATIVQDVKTKVTRGITDVVINLDVKAEASSESLLSYLRWLNSADSIASRQVISDMFSGVLVDTGEIVIDVLAHSTVELVRENTVSQVSTYIVTPSVNTIMSAFLGMIMFFRGRGGRAVARRGGRYKKSMKRRPKHKKSTKKHRKHKKSTKKHRKHKKSSKK